MQLRGERRMEDCRDERPAQRVPLRLLSDGTVLEHRVLRRDPTSSRVLRDERRPARRSDVRPAAVNLLLHPVAEGAHRCRGAAVVATVPRQRCRHSSTHVRPHPAPRSVSSKRKRNHLLKVTGSYPSGFGRGAHFPDIGR